MDDNDRAISDLAARKAEVNDRLLGIIEALVERVGILEARVEELESRARKRTKN